MARAYHNANDLYNAEENYLKVIGFKLDHKRSHQYLSDIYYGKEDFKNCIRHFVSGFPNLKEVFKNFEYIKLGNCLSNDID